MQKIMGWWFVTNGGDIFLPFLHDFSRNNQHFPFNNSLKLQIFM
jgi:hypothetical protein